jgi:Zn finger protein HypA/HybF involved in hydrogenase expression
MPVTKPWGSSPDDATSGAAASCWHCQKRAPDPAAASRLRLRKYDGDHVEDTTVLIPACPTCADARRRIRVLWWALLGVALAAVAVGIAVSVTSPGTVADVLLVVGFTAPFVILLVGAVGQIRATRRAGIVHADRVSFPEVVRLRHEGWTTMRLPLHLFRSAEKAVAGIEQLQEWVDRGPSSRKTCSKCHAEVPLTSHQGQSCPHCGAYWGLPDVVYTVPR